LPGGDEGATIAHHPDRLTTGACMTIENDKVVTLHYSLFNADDGSEIENSRETGEPMAYLHGYNNIIKGLESALAGKAVGDEVDVTVSPADAYGEYDNTLFQRISRKYLKHAGKLAPGKVVTVPLAGKSLRFVVEITDIRDASEEEKAHKHAHGVGGHQH
jgi:FKBP-type peptidyl-prolyl cis-trans isomerase SlyD